MAQATASTALGNSTSNPSPVVLTTRPRWAVTLESDHLAAVSLQRAQGAHLVGPHKPTVANDVHRHDRGEPALYRPPRGGRVLTLKARQGTDAVGQFQQ